MKIFVFGDSIAYGKWDEEGGWVQRLRAYIDAKHNLKKDDENYQVFNLGIPGEVSIRLVKRIDAELTSRIFDEDNLVVLAIGTNDSCSNNWLSGEQTPDGDFKKSVSELIETALRHKCKVVGIGLMPVDKSKSKGPLFNNPDVAKYNEILREVYKSKAVPFLDLFEELQKNNFTDLLVDAVHPNSNGHRVLFERIQNFLQQENLI